MVTDPYRAGLFKKNPYAEKLDIKGNLVVVLSEKLEGRNLQLMTPISRALNRHEIHELIITDEEQAAPAQRVNNIAYLGFFEVLQGSVLVVGDEVFLDNQLVGHIAGFDETHMPNHLNIIIKRKERLTGIDLGAKVGMEIVCKKPQNNYTLP